jgi:hypothetical protein
LYRISLFTLARLADSPNLIITAIADHGLPHWPLNAIAFFTLARFANWLKNRITALTSFCFPDGHATHNLTLLAYCFLLNPIASDFPLLVDRLANDAIFLSTGP